MTKSLYACGEAVLASLERIATAYKKFFQMQVAHQLDDETSAALAQEIAESFSQLNYCLDAAYELTDICQRQLVGRETPAIEVFELLVDNDVNALVMDIGSFTTKIGYAGEENPLHCFPTAMGTIPNNEYRGNSGFVGKDKKTRYFMGVNTLCVRQDNMAINNPYERGTLSDVSLLEEIWRYSLFHRMRVDPREHPIMYSDPPIPFMSVRNRTAEVFFEEFECPAFYMANEAMLSAFANGRSTALVLKCGHQTMSVTPVHDGYVLKSGTLKTTVAGEFLTMVLRELLKEKDVDIVPLYGFNRRMIKDNEFRVTYRTFPQTHPSYAEFMQLEVVRDIKEGICRVTDRPFDASSSDEHPTLTHNLPDGRQFEIGAERTAIPELLFNSSFSSAVGGDSADSSLKKIVNLPNEFGGIQQMIYASISACDADIRKELVGSVIVSGGSSLLPGFPERLHKELMPLFPNQMKIKMIASSTTSERKFTPWIGGSILASLGTFHGMWISKQDYEEFGAESVLRHKCPL